MSVLRYSIKNLMRVDLDMDALERLQWKDFGNGLSMARLARQGSRELVFYRGRADAAADAFLKHEQIGGEFYLRLRGKIIEETGEYENGKSGWEVLDGSAGGVEEAAAAGTLALWLSGSKELFDQHQPVFQAMGKKIVHVGELGNAKLVKNAMAMFAAIQHLGLAEIFSWLK